MHFYSFSFICLFTHSPLSPLPSSSSPCYFTSFLFLMHDPSFHPSFQFPISPHSTTFCHISAKILQAGSIPACLSCNKLFICLPSWLPEAFPSRSTSSCPSAGQVPQRALVLTRGGGFSQALSLNKGQLVKQGKRKDRDCLCSTRSLGLPMEEVLGWWK